MKPVVSFLLHFETGVQTLINPSPRTLQSPNSAIKIRFPHFSTKRHGGNKIPLQQSKEPRQETTPRPKKAYTLTSLKLQPPPTLEFLNSELDNEFWECHVYLRVQAQTGRWQTGPSWWCVLCARPDCKEHSGKEKEAEGGSSADKEDGCGAELRFGALLNTYDELESTEHNRGNRQDFAY